ncbi:helix-turn-helix transcriptional regulator [Nocardia sp. NPDC004860]|uniref:helix-turn-helix domain-containing protein n=1 Tax=Nocardia sp. NPDC004860 TaxID=3154557 RepID=UPI0033BA6278
MRNRLSGTERDSARLKSARRWTWLGWSQETAAHACGSYWIYLGQIERGRRSPRLGNILRFAHGLQTTPGMLLDGLPGPFPVNE